MYIPEHFQMDLAEAEILLKNAGAADVIAARAADIQASFLPLHLESQSSVTATDDAQLTASSQLPILSLTTHIAKINPLAAMDGSPALAIFHGADAFIRSKWLSDVSGETDGASWNYLTVHVHGMLRIHRDPEWMTAQVMRHSVALEPDFKPEDFPADRLSKLLRAMYGLEIVVHRIEAKAKMSQNKSPQTITAVISGLRACGCDQVADWMENNSLPRAIAKSENLARLRAQVSGTNAAVR